MPTTGTIYVVGGLPRPDRRRLVLATAADRAEAVLFEFESVFPRDDRPRKAIEAARAWLRGEITVGSARAAAFAAHAAARQAGTNVAAVAAARAAAHAAAVAHVADHLAPALAYANKASARSPTKIFGRQGKL